ncbi:Threonine/homoserine/homoserine lactone efflux protein [Amycolatopsis pretoriensis]|uniref:Threonine/homoserine/homoserine lactone efflux protein n=1 Tax=Amycolatopsis pretoriensis TaxID=218821 RepID=A0A1H5Q4K7_9PSEU|nr:LysE family transporter [Amycolatopsis pretoriensis]SEF20331.1 Threonine/homoserine/homoserine lactone efflux protein [Amycolatopsis pretoriensis]
MNPAATLGTVLLAYLPAAVSPGPNFVLIAHTAAAGTRKAAVAVALGVVAAGGLLAAVAVFGLGAVLAREPWLATALRVVCGAYLAWLGVKLWLRAQAPDAAPPAGRGGAFRQGVVSNLTNPKAAAFFGSVLTAALPPTEPTAVKLAAVALIIIASTAWHLSVALLFSSPATQRWYARAKPALNRVVGTILVVLGITLAVTP